MYDKTHYNKKNNKKNKKIKKRINKVSADRKEIKIKHKIFQLIKTKHYKSPFFLKE